MGKELKIELTENIGMADKEPKQQNGPKKGLIGSFMEKLWKNRSSSDESKTP